MIKKFPGTFFNQKHFQPEIPETFSTRNFKNVFEPNKFSTRKIFNQFKKKHSQPQKKNQKIHKKLTKNLKKITPHLTNFSIKKTKHLKIFTSNFKSISIHFNPFQSISNHFIFSFFLIFFQTRFAASYILIYKLLPFIRQEIAARASSNYVHYSCVCFHSTFLHDF